MPAVAIALDVPCIIIENVQSITRATERVVELSTAILKKHGYFVEETIITASDFGVAQNRPRHFLIASKISKPKLEESLQGFSVERLTFDDIYKRVPVGNGGVEYMKQSAALSSENKARIDYLHDNNLFELPNHQRPDCHRDGHTYPSVYGRIRGDQPLGTITTGFASPGRGRFIHPHERRALNLLEAARAQGFPDWYWKNAEEAGISRNKLNKIIGDAVPSLMVMPLMASLYDSFATKLLQKAG
jgi:DNA (cytosine-5)-methyltransferase 1